MTTDPKPVAKLEDGDRDEWERDVADLEKHSFADTPESGTRLDLHGLWRRVAFGGGLVLALFHLYTGFFGTLPGLQQRSFHLALALALVFLIYPAKPQQTKRQRQFGWALVAAGVGLLGYLAIDGAADFYVVLPALAVLATVQAARYLPWTVLGIPPADILLSLLGAGSGLYVFVFYEDIVRAPGLIDPVHVAVGTVGVLLILVAAQRTLGTALVVLASVMLGYAYLGEYFSGFLRHSGYTIDRIISTSFLGTGGVFGTPLGISATFIFLFLIFAAMLQRTGMERFFTDLALGSTGWATGGTAKVGVVTSAFSGTITGSSVANTVSNGAFTIPMMKKSGYNREYAGAVEAASSTGGQLAPPIMGAAAFIMIEFTGVPYLQIIKAAVVPAVLFFVAQFVVIHYDSKRMGIMGVPKRLLPSVRRLLLTRGYLLAPIVAIFVLLSMGYSPIRAAMGAIGITVGINLLVQFLVLPVRTVDGRLGLRPLRDMATGAVRLSLPIILSAGAAALIVEGVTASTQGLGRSNQIVVIVLGISVIAALVAFAFRGWRNSDEDKLTLNSLLDGLVAATRIALPIIVACAAAGMIAGVITLTGLGLKLSGGLVDLAQGMLIPTLVLSMLACLILGIGLPTTANYVITATLAAPAIITILQGDLEAPTVAMLLMAHMFVYYFGVMADITPPVCLAAYAASGVSGGNPIMTGVQSVRIAVSGFVVPFMFVLSPELLLQDVTWVSGTLAAATGVIGASLVGVGVVGYINRRVPWVLRGLLVVAGIALLYSGWLSDLAGLAAAGAVFAQQWWVSRGARSTGEAAPASAAT
ncbi:TRAP transporter permease [Allosalinactinospora lopnorensis]|uniref:TRAP transporter permease n=1 Tax=Allosalinactinospora lopnorensis TaxID=1352348 RepID=UPI000623C878|nr:TRAP transporter permease [Allosalinactinospora lopnorensis]